MDIMDLRNRSQLADMANKAWHPIYKTTLAEAVNAVTITTDVDGKAINLTRAALRIVAPAGCSAPTGTSANVNLKINDIATGYKDPFNATDNGSALWVGPIRNLFGAITCDIDILNATCASFKSTYAYSDGTARVTGTANAAILSGITAITKMYFNLSGAYTFPAGTVIEVWGCNA